MEVRSLLQSFAVDKDGRIRSVEEVSRGLACECRCPGCGELVIARQGNVRVWHFAHTSGTDCEGAAESSLHLAAKQLLLERRGMTIPRVDFSATVTLKDGRTGIGEVSRPPRWVDFLSVEAEKGIGQMRPDIVALVGPEILCVEIAVTHPVEAEKRRNLIDQGIAAVEVNLAGVERENWDWDILREAVVDGIHQKVWIQELGRAALEQEARALALQNASEQRTPQPPKRETKDEAPRTRFWIAQRIVHVTKYPFGLTVWSPYDPALNERLKELLRGMGGRWQRHFKNWLVPLEAEGPLFEALTNWSARPPARL